MGARKNHLVTARLKPPGAGVLTLELTKIDVAEAQIRTAVRLFFEEGHPVPVYLLASSAREILTTIGIKVGVETVLQELAEAHGVGLKEAIESSHRWANFFKHADRDATARITFKETEIDSVLFTACNDFVTCPDSSAHG
jgi:hypothetical protein